LLPSGTIRGQQNRGNLVRRVVTVVTALAAVLVVAPAAAAQSPDPTVTVTEFDCESVTVTGAGWEQTEATVEVAVPPSEGGETREDLVAGPVQVFPDAQGNIPPTVVPFNAPPPDGDYAAVVLVDNIVRGQSAGFTLTGCRAPTTTTPPTTGPPIAALPRTGSSTVPLLTVGLLLVGLGLALVRRSRTS
jgi:LPXTG-motif cell wall-anchored protein